MWKEKDYILECAIVLVNNLDYIGVRMPNK
jgi:hypothetical protein